MWFTRYCATHLAGKAIAIKHKCACLFGDVTFKGWNRRWIKQQILPWF